MEGGGAMSDTMTATQRIKLIEIRDRATFIAAMAIRVSGEDGWLMRRAGFQSPMVYLVALATERACYDPYNWGNRTMANAHHHISEHWDELKSGDVVDVEFIRGETTEKKVSEQISHPI